VGQYFHRRQWWLDRADDLTTLPFAEFAAKHGVNTGAAKSARHRLGLPPRRKEKPPWRIDWSKVDWDQRNSQIARALNRTGEAVRVARLKVGYPYLRIPKPPPVKPKRPPPKLGKPGYWKLHLDDLVRLTVAQVMAKHGCNVAAVYSARKHYRIGKVAPLKRGPK
jgi:hypothetical protein